MADFIYHLSDRPAQKFYQRSLVVIGSGEFPVDMLRRDNCVPAWQGSANLIQADRHAASRSGEPRIIELRMMLRGEEQKPTFEEWNSFGWIVLEFDGKEVIRQNLRGDHAALIEIYHAHIEKINDPVRHEAMCQEELS